MYLFQFNTTSSDEYPADLPRSRRRRFDLSSHMCLGGEIKMNLSGANGILVWSEGFCEYLLNWGSDFQKVPPKVILWVNVP